MRDAIRSGVLKTGVRLPPVREMAWDLGITPGTVARAYKMAAEEGLVETAVGRGTFVTGGLVTEMPEDSLLTPAAPDYLDFRAVRVADVGQGTCIRQIMGELSRGTAHGYIDYPTTQTDYAARAAIAQWIGPDRAGRIGADDVVLSLGAQNAVMMALQGVLHGSSPVILTETLAYPGVRHAARLLRAQLIGLEMDADGIRPDRMEEALRRHGGQVLLTAAEVHSPTTTRTSFERKQQIANLARKYQLQIIEDDCHCVSRAEIPGYRAICPERAWFISSLSKTVSSAVRIGYAVAPKGLAAQARQVAQSTFYGLPQPLLDMAAMLLRSGEAEKFRAQVEAVICEKVRVAVNILGPWDINWRPDVPFIWLRLPQGWRGSTFARACEAQGIRVKPADEFALPDGQAPNAVRISLDPNIPGPDYEAALKRMSTLLAAPPLNVDL
ncbi:MAG: PLP-dependent aminotransferase family protein [Pseudomonadota bacterium]